MITSFKPQRLRVRGKEVTITQPWVMGILNVTPDSFYSGSRCQTEQAIVSRVERMLHEGVDVIDVGAYSTRPGADVVSAEQEQERLAMAMSIIRQMAPETLTSIDTFRASVARSAVEQMGADMINDVSGGTLDEQMFPTVAQLQVPYILMHMRGTPATMQQLTDYDNVVYDVISDLRDKLNHLHDMGVNDVIVDPGFGFSKTVDQNYELMAHLADFHQLQAPLLVGISRKSMIYKPLAITPEDALNGTTVLNAIALMAGTHILRVHDVREAVEARELVNRCMNSK